MNLSSRKNTLTHIGTPAEIYVNFLDCCTELKIDGMLLQSLCRPTYQKPLYKYNGVYQIW